MCGIVGFWCEGHADTSTIEKMALKIQHRGPDDTGVWGDNQSGIALAHRRLSILDLSPAGHQPMLSPCGRFTLVYNGEIYNHMELRVELEREGGHFDWRGHSDTETLLAGLRHWGVKDTLQRINGMFAFALWDRLEKKLILARDRMGEKPLYYGHSGKSFLFGSELKALKVHSEWRGLIDRSALALYMRHSYIPAPWSIYQGISKLLPAHYVVISNGGERVSEAQCYWHLGEIATSDISDKPSAEIVNDLDILLRDAVSRRMVSDVPIGAFLSGGFDSSLIAAMMQSQSSVPVKTFTIGFHEEGYNEAVHAKAVAKHLGTDHTELYISPDEAMAVIPDLPYIWDEPFADSSQIPTLLVSKLARKDVSVSLSGDGGDELFFGYGRYTQGYKFWKILRLFPAPVRRLFGAMLRRFPGASVEHLLLALPTRFQVKNLADRLPKLAEIIAVGSGEEYYHRLISLWKDPSSVVLGSQEYKTLFTTPEKMPKLSGLREQMMYLDSLNYLPDDILTKVDRASMAVSLEARVPILDHRVVEFSWTVPQSLKYRDGKGKWLLREVLYRYIPRELMDRPKMGFGVPIDEWLCGPLREWAEDLLDEKRLQEEGFFDPIPIRKMWDEHVAGSRRWHSYLWNVLMFQAWLDAED